MKKLFLILVLLCYVSTKASAQHVINELTFIVEHVHTGEDGVFDPLTLLDEDSEVVYQTVVPSSVSVVVLPATLSGDFELQLDYGGNYYFYCEIAL